MDPAERLFLNLISDFTVDDIKTAIANNVDLAEQVQQALPDYIEYAKGMAKTYVSNHPRVGEELKDPLSAAKKLVAYLKVYRPVLGYEIELYRSHATTAGAGFRLKTDGSAAGGTMVEKQEEHAGYAWVANNIVGLSELLL